MLRRLIRHPRTQAAFAALGSLYLLLVAWTTRWTVLGAEPIEGFLGDPARRAHPDHPPTAIVAFWHERLGAMPIAWRHARRAIPILAGMPMHVLVSRHRDGRMIGDVAERFGLTMVHASSSRGGAVGLLAMARLLSEGALVAITPDGPRGPRRQAAPGVAHLAAQTGRPVVPVAARVRRSLVLRTWDRMLAPLPFGRGVIVIGPLIEVPPQGAEAALPAIEAAMTEACERADAWAEGRAPATGAPARPGPAAA